MAHLCTIFLCMIFRFLSYVGHVLLSLDNHCAMWDPIIVCKLKSIRHAPNIYHARYPAIIYSDWLVLKLSGHLQNSPMFAHHIWHSFCECI